MFDGSEFDGVRGRFSRLPEDMSYDEWKEAKGVEPFFKAARNVNRNMDMHEEYSNLYKQYKGVFSKAVPKNFNDFQDLKYNDTQAWRQMVLDARLARNAMKNPEKYSRAIALKSLDNGGGSGIIKEKIQNNEIKLEINPEKQGKHIKESEYYKDGRSYLTISENEVQELVYKYSGTGEIKITKKGQIRETIITDHQIGININPITKEEIPTNTFKIHYSKTGTHIVPTQRRSEND